MSAFAAIFRRDLAPASSPALAAMAEALAHRGPDGSDRWADGPAAVACQHHWVTSEEVGERQPIHSSGLVLVLDGRLDNRGELADLLEIGDGGVTDAELLLAAYRRWGEECCHHLLGPFAFALYEVDAGSWLLARDPLGDRTLFYTEGENEIAIASEEVAIAAHPELSRGLSERRLLQFFAGEVPSDGSTFFEGVRELRPGHRLRIGREGFREDRYWALPEPGGSSVRGDADLADEFRELLTLAVACRWRSRAAPAVLMSGGIDSTAVAALAPLEGGRRSISWVFDDLTECDERRFVRPVVEALDLESLEVPGDGLGPEPDHPALILNPNGPEENPYRLLKNAAYRTAVERGSQVVLTGGSADALYTGFERWWSEALTEGRLGALFALAGEVLRVGPRTALRRAGWRRPHRDRAPWLTPWARDRLDSDATESESTDARIEAACGARAARSITLEVSNAARSGVDLRHPYRDLRLVEFMLRLPARQLYERGRFKPIARRALAGELPRIVLERRGPTPLSPLFDRAVRRQWASEWRAALQAPDVEWPRYVRREWVDAALERSGGPRADVALWNCLAFERWRQLTTRAGSPSSVMPKTTSR